MKIIKIVGKPGLLFGLVFSISISGCTGKSSSDNVATGGQNVLDVSDSENPDQAGDLSFIDDKNNIVSLKSLTGKVVFINFWAIWCPPCIREMPSIDALKKSLANHKDIVFLMVDVDGNLAKSQAFMQKHKYDLTALAPRSEIPSQFLGGAIPTTVILDKKGAIAGRLEGGRDYATADFIDALIKLLGEN